MMSNNASKKKLDTICEAEFNQDLVKLETPKEAFRKKRSSTTSNCSKSITNAKYMKVKTKLFKYMKEINF